MCDGVACGAWVSRHSHIFACCTHACRPTPAQLFPPVLVPLLLLVVAFCCPLACFARSHRNLLRGESMTTFEHRPGTHDAVESVTFGLPLIPLKDGRSSMVP